MSRWGSFCLLLLIIAICNILTFSQVTPPPFCQSPPQPITTPAGWPASTQPTPADAVTPSPIDVYTVATTHDTGTQTVGEHRVQVQYANTLRFEVALGATVTFTEAPSIPSTFALSPSTFPQITQPQTSSNAPAVVGLRPAPPPPPPDFDPTWRSYYVCYQVIQSRLVALDSALNQSAGITQAVLRRVTTILNANNQKLVASYIPLRQSANQGDTFAGYFSFPWPTQQIYLLKAFANTFRDEYAKLTTDAGYADWIQNGGNKDAFDLVRTQTDKAIEHLNALAPTSDTATKLDAAQDLVEQWHERFVTVANTDVNGFMPHYDVHCDAWFGRGKSTVVKLSTRDLLNSSATEETSDLVTVVCNPPLTVTTGLGFTTIPEKVPGFIPGIKKDSNGNPVLDDNGNAVIVDRLGYTSESRIKPIYALQLNVALKDCSNGIGIHGTFGSAVGSANDTTNLEFLFGPSFSFLRRTFYITPAFHLGRRSDFLPDFKVGDEKGNLTSPPTKMTWKPGFAVTFTFPVTK